MYIENVDNITKADSFPANEAAGRVNFNTASASDLLTNEAYKTLRTNILFCGTDIKSIVITSTQGNEGKSTISTELSKSLADIGKKTLLIDADMRKSVMLRKSLKSRNISGLSELLSGQAELRQVLYNTQHSNFDVIFCGHFPPNPVELLSCERFKQLLNDLKKIYDYIIIDSPPIGAVIDAAVICSVCDSAIMVVSSGNISYTDASAAKDQITKSGCKLLGTILNDVNSKNSTYYKCFYKQKSYKYYCHNDKKRSK